MYFQLILNFTIKDYQGNKYDDYHYPDWANTVGWCITFSSVVCIPIVGLFKIARAEGSLAPREDQRLGQGCDGVGVGAVAVVVVFVPAVIVVVLVVVRLL